MRVRDGWEWHNSEHGTWLVESCPSVSHPPVFLPSPAQAAAAAAKEDIPLVASPLVVVHKSDPSTNKNVHVADRKHRGASRNVLGGFFTS